MRILILSADVGEGHVAAARALEEGLVGYGETGVHRQDGLYCLGRIARHVIRDGYRAQLRWTPWAYNLLYRLWHRIPPLRWLGARLLYWAGRRRLSALLERQRPDIVVSTHPALTAVLGRMRRRGELDAILCATITDLIDDPAWCHRSADLHIVMHPTAVAWVERRAGQGSAIAVRPLVSGRFYAPRDVTRSRRALELPTAGSLVVVSGGGWGVGALDDGVDAVLAAGADRVVVLAGHNLVARARLERRFGADARVRVMGFTDRMPELLVAATALVHGTGGVTSLEAVACGCPVIGFGTGLAHVRDHNHAMEALGLCSVAHDVLALRRAIAAQLAAGDPPAAAVSPLLDGARAVLDAVPRVRPLPRWVMRAQRLTAALGATGMLLWSLSTDDAFSLAASPLNLRPVTHLRVHSRSVALVVSTAPGQIPVLAAALGRHGVHVTFSVGAMPSPSALVALRRWHDEALPMLARSGAVDWLDTRDDLLDLESATGGHDFLVPRGGLSFGQYLLARSAGDVPVAPQRVRASGGGQVPLRPGGILLVKATGAGALWKLVGRATAEGVAVQTLSGLIASSSMAARIASERPSRLPAATTTRVTATPDTPSAAAP